MIISACTEPLPTTVVPHDQMGDRRYAGDGYLGLRVIYGFKDRARVDKHLFAWIAIQSYGDWGALAGSVVAQHVRLIRLVLGPKVCFDLRLMSDRALRRLSVQRSWRGQDIFDLYPSPSFPALRTVVIITGRDRSEGDDHDDWYQMYKPGMRSMFIAGHPRVPRWNLDVAARRAFVPRFKEAYYDQLARVVFRAPKIETVILACGSHVRGLSKSLKMVTERGQHTRLVVQGVQDRSGPTTWTSARDYLTHLPSSLPFRLEGFPTFKQQEIRAIARDDLGTVGTGGGDSARRSWSWAWTDGRVESFELGNSGRGPAT